MMDVICISDDDDIPAGVHTGTVSSIKSEFVSGTDVVCIVCSQSLFGLLDSERHHHVNQCLDTNSHTITRQSHINNQKSTPSAPLPQAELCVSTPILQAAAHTTVQSHQPISFTATPSQFSFNATSTTNSLNGLSVCSVCGIDISQMKWKLAVDHMKKCKLQQSMNNDDIVITDSVVVKPEPDNETKWKSVVNKRKSLPRSKSISKKAKQQQPLSSNTIIDVGNAPTDVNSVLKPISAAKLNKALYVNRWSKRIMGNDYNTAFGRKGTNKSDRVIPAYKQLENTGILIDGFHFKSPVGIYYLTHYHSDHYTGLTKNFDGRKLYCSHITARLVEMFFKITPPVLHPLELHKRHYLDGIYVTLIDANHCPGANVLIYEVPLYMCITNKDINANTTDQYNQSNDTSSHASNVDGASCIVTPSRSDRPYTGECRVWVHCGDFRYHRSMRDIFLTDSNMIESTIFPSSYHLSYYSAAYRSLCSHISQLNIYGVFLDTTYCNSRYNFPPQGDSVGYAVQAVKEILHKESEYNAQHGLTDMVLHPSKFDVESDSDDDKHTIDVDILSDDEHNQHAVSNADVTDIATATIADNVMIDTCDNRVIEDRINDLGHATDTPTNLTINNDIDVNQPQSLQSLQTHNNVSSVDLLNATSPSHNTDSSWIKRRTRDGEVKLISSSSNNFMGRLFSGVKQSINRISSAVNTPSSTDSASAWKNLLGGYTKQYKQSHATRTLFLVGTYSVGKEKVFVEMAKQCNLSIYVTSDRRRMLSVLELDKHIPTGAHCDIDTMTQQQHNTLPTVHFTTNPLQSRLHVVPLGYINKQNIMKYVDPAVNPKAAKLFFPLKPSKSTKKTSFDARYQTPHNPLLPYNRIVAFRPTGWVGNKPYTTDFYVNIDNPDTTCEKKYNKSTLHITIHHVPYSEHSTYNELKEFIAVLSECGLQSIVPTVSPYISNQIIQKDFVHMTLKNIDSTHKPGKILQHKLNFHKVDHSPAENDENSDNNSTLGDEQLMQSSDALL